MRYIRLIELVSEILQMVDEYQITFRPAVESSYLSDEQQYTLLEALEYNDITLSFAQAIKMKKFMQEGKLTDEVIQSIRQEEKPNGPEVCMDGQINLVSERTVDVNILEYISSIRKEPHVMEKVAKPIHRFLDYEIIGDI